MVIRVARKKESRIFEQFLFSLDAREERDDMGGGSFFICREELLAHPPVRVPPGRGFGGARDLQADLPQAFQGLVLAARYRHRPMMLAYSDTARQDMPLDGLNRPVYTRPSAVMPITETKLCEGSTSWREITTD